MCIRDRAEAALEQPAEMRGMGEASLVRQLGDAAMALRRVQQQFAAALQALVEDEAFHRQVAGLEDAVQVGHRQAAACLLYTSGKLKAVNSALASSSVFAVVVMLMFLSLIHI